MVSRLLDSPVALTRFGVPFIEIPGWQGRGAPGAFKVAVGHHVAGAPGLAIILGGRPDLPPPLAQWNLRLDGVVNICASGVANHAGGSGNGPWKGVRGNTFMVGLEADNWPDFHWTDVQLHSYWGAMAAFCWLMGVDASYCCGHMEIGIPLGRKIDPKFASPFIDMNHMRALIQNRLDHPQGSDATEPPIEMEDLSDMDSFIAVVTTPNGKRYYEINKKGGLICVVVMAQATAKGLGTQFFKRGGLTHHAASAAYVKWHAQNADKTNIAPEDIARIGQ